VADTDPRGTPFKLWRSSPGNPEEVFAEGFVADDGALTVTMVLIGKLPRPRELNLDTMLEHLGNSGPGVSFRVELPDSEGDG
jgi:hypothetical protein